MQWESILFESRALFITLWVVFFLHLVRDPFRTSLHVRLRSRATGLAVGNSPKFATRYPSIAGWVLQAVNPYVQFWQNSAERIAEIQRLEIHVVTIGPQWMKSPPSSFNPKMTMSH